MLAIPAGAFDTDKETIELQIQEAFTEMDIIKAGLSTTSNGELLQTAGMFSVRAFDGKQELQWKKKVSMLIPTEEVDPDMMLFNGEILEDGTVNWINPLKIDNDLPLVDIHNLDFYPQNFIPTLKSIGEPTNNKEYTDSIYYSFSGYSFGSDDLLTALEPMLYQYSNNEGDSWELVSQDWVDSTRWNGDDHGWLRMTDSVKTTNPTETAPELDPSRIKAIWNDDFAKTLLATRAFEERLKFIHSTCRPDFLEAYVSHLDWQMWEIDSLCMTMASGAHKEKFREFYRRKDGGVKVSSALAKSLSNRYENKQKAWKEAVSAVWKAHYKELDSLAFAAALRREKFSYKDAIREITVFGDELCRNMKDAYQQIGGEAFCNEPLPDYYTLDLTTPGWKNLDKYVMEATVNRENMSYTDPNTGKTATLTYTPVNLSIESEESYDRVLLYLIPDSLSSFQRIYKKEGAWTEKLNGNLNYQLVAVAYKGTNFFWTKVKKLTPGTYALKLAAGNEKELQDHLSKRGVFRKPLSKNKLDDFAVELNFRRFEIIEGMRLDKVRRQQEWRNTIAYSIFECLVRASVPAPGSTEIEKGS